MKEPKVRWIPYSQRKRAKTLKQQAQVYFPASILERLLETESNNMHLARTLNVEIDIGHLMGNYEAIENAVREAYMEKLRRMSRIERLTHPDERVREIAKLLEEEK